MASILRRLGPGGKRVWQAQIRRKGFPAQIRTFDTKAEAEAWSATIESEIARGVFVSRSEAESTTLGEALARYRREVTPAKKGAGIERFRLDRWDAHRYAQRSMASIRGKDVADYIEERRQEGAAPATIHKEINLLSHLFNTARRMGYGVPDKPCRSCERSASEGAPRP